MRVESSVTGGCLCGAIRYRAEGNPLSTLYCHCTSCRRHTGAPLVALAGYGAAQVAWTAGTPRRYASSDGVARAYCGNCGTPLTWEGDGGADGPLVELLIGTMDDPGAMGPACHIHVREQVPWLHLADSLPRYGEWHDDGAAPTGCRTVASARQIERVERYFAAVDREDPETIRALLTEDCVFTVETHGVRLDGLAGIEAMFRRLWANHAGVRHLDFTHLPDPGAGRIASRFRVENTERDGSITHKSNCNFFDLEGDRFSRISVFMAGPNTLKGD